MRDFFIKRSKEENGAVSVLVFVTVLTFVVILLGAYLTVTTMRQSQLKSDIRLQKIYGEDVEKVDQIYNELIENRQLTNSYNTNQYDEDTINEI